MSEKLRDYLLKRGIPERIAQGASDLAERLYQSGKLTSEKELFNLSFNPIEKEPAEKMMQFAKFYHFVGILTEHNIFNSPRKSCSFSIILNNL